MGKRTQLRLDRETLLLACNLEIEKKSDRELSELSKAIFGTTLNCCGSFDSIIFTTNLNMVNNETLLKLSDVIDIEDHIASIIQTAKSHYTGDKARAKATIELIKNGHHIERQEFEQAFLALGGEHV